MKGIKSIDNGEYACAECNQKISKDGKIVLNFCPKCGNPLNMNASVKFENEIDKEKIKMLYEILDHINEGNDPLLEIKECIKELSESLN